MTSNCCLPNGLFHSRFPTKALHTFLFSPIRATCPAHLILIRSSLCSFLQSLLPFYPRHPTLGHQQPVFCNLHNTSLSVRDCTNSPLQLIIKIIAILQQICSPSGQTISGTIRLPKATKQAAFSPLYSTSARAPSHCVSSSLMTTESALFSHLAPVLLLLVSDKFLTVSELLTFP